jgi:biopolymer transport protein ExbB
MLISQTNMQINRFLPLIKTLVALCPLLGLLGTVTGMIEVFNIMAVTGGGDAKSMAGGVQQATIPTMAGMVAALSGIFANTYVTNIAQRESEFLQDNLTTDH